MRLRPAPLLATGLLALALCVSGAGAEGQVPLIEAVRQADLGAVRALLDQGVDVDASTVDGTTALHWAVQRDAEEAATLLIQAGADVSATSDVLG